MNKRMVTILSALFLLFLCTAFNAFAVNVSIPNMNADKGATVQIPINLDDAIGIAGFQFTIIYNSSVLNCTGTSIAGCLTSMDLDEDGTNDWIIVRNSTSGQIIIGGTTTLEESVLTGGSGCLVKLRCDVVGNPLYCTTLEFASKKLVNFLGEEIPSTSTNGEFCVNCTPTGPDTNCDGVDDDCNGVADDGYVPTATSCGKGVCASEGQLICQNGQLVDTCQPGNPTGSDDNCNGLDENCNGTNDENYVATPTTCGVGACASTGQNTCVSGQIQNTCVPGTPTTEVCDNIDNNCNGSVDENLTRQSTCGVGACASTGTETCTAGQWGSDTCTPGTPQTEGPFGNATCSDGIDNDCDGATDATDGDCKEVCIPTGPDTNCDGVDDDCDGVADDGYTPKPIICGIGACENTVMTSCQNGVEDFPVCIPGTPQTEGPFGAATCSDGIDNDCDGVTDVADGDCVPAVGVSIPEKDGNKGAVVSIPVNVDISTGIAGFQFTIIYNSAVLNCTGTMVGSLTNVDLDLDGMNDWIITTNATPGQMIVGGVDQTLTGLPGGSGSLLELTCNVVGNIGDSTSLDFTYSKLVDSSGKEIASTTNSGTLTVIGIPPRPGDLDGDGDIDKDDYQIFVSAFGKCEGQVGFNANADYDGDGCITFVDYQEWYGCYINQINQ
jgi:hypothetical protein